MIVTKLMMVMTMFVKITDHSHELLQFHFLGTLGSVLVKLTKVVQICRSYLLEVVMIWS